MGMVDHLDCVHGRYLGSFVGVFSGVFFSSSILLKAAYGLFGGMVVFFLAWMDVAPHGRSILPLRIHYCNISSGTFQYRDPDKFCLL